MAALTVTAPSTGIVYGLPRKAGETVSAGQVVASVADPNTCACGRAWTSRTCPASPSASG